MMAEQEVTDLQTETLITVKQASQQFHIREDTLKYRIAHNKLPGFIKTGPTGKDTTFVRLSDMENQPPVDPKYRSRAEKKQPTRKYNKKGQTDVSKPQEETYVEAQDQQLERHVCYAFGRVQAWLDIYAGGIGTSPSVFANRVGKLLQSSESGGSLGIGIKLSRM